MAFTSFYFFLFLPLVVIIFYFLPVRFRWIWLLITSICFYLLFSRRYFLLFAGIILFNYFTGLFIHKKDGRVNYLVYVSAIAVNLLILALFKYFPEISGVSEKIAQVLDLQYPVHITRLIFPLGLSFFIFTVISYLIDIKKKTIEPEKNPAMLATFFLFFPRIMQGPIDRAGKVLPQLRGNLLFDYENVTNGLKLMAWGFFKKLVIADRMGNIVNAVYSTPSEYSGLTMAVATLFFAFQVYADFSGYTDIALGAARIFGIRLIPNFRGPYLSTSIKDFWNRWHISLSYWLRDYIFLPLAYSISRNMKKEHYLSLRTDKWIYVLSVSVTFFLCGMWHGVGWNYVTWGLLFALYLSFAQVTEKQRKRLNKRSGLNDHPFLLKTVRVILTFVLVTFAWIFFRAGSVGEAFTVIGNLFTGWSVFQLHESIAFFASRNMILRDFVILGVSVILLILADHVSETTDVIERISRQHRILRWTIYFILILVIILYGDFGQRTFIYQQF